MSKRSTAAFMQWVSEYAKKVYTTDAPITDREMALMYEAFEAGKDFGSLCSRSLE
jgi:hypothetical protein